MDVQLVAPGLEIHIAERLKLADFQLGELNEHPAVLCESLEVRMALTIQIRTHLLNLEIRHVADALAQRALMAARPSELEALDKTSMREHLPGRADNLGQTGVAHKNTDDMGAACDPDNGFVFFSLQLPLRIDLEKLRVQGSLKKAEGQLVDSYFDRRCFHKRIIPTQVFSFYYVVIIQELPFYFKLIFSTDNAETGVYRTIIVQTLTSKRLTAMRFFA